MGARIGLPWPGVTRVGERLRIELDLRRRSADVPATRVPPNPLRFMRWARRTWLARVGAPPGTCAREHPERVIVPVLMPLACGPLQCSPLGTSRRSIRGQPRYLGASRGRGRFRSAASDAKMVNMSLVLWQSAPVNTAMSQFAAPPNWASRRCSRIIATVSQKEDLRATRPLLHPTRRTWRGSGARLGGRTRRRPARWALHSSSIWKDVALGQAPARRQARARLWQLIE